MAHDQDLHESYDRLFSSIFERYAVGLLVYAQKFVGRHEIAEDIVHDVFMNMWERRSSISFDTSGQYLFRSTRNSCLNHLKHLKYRTAYQNEILREQNLIDSLDTDFYVHSDLQAHIEAAIEKLPPQRKKIFMMNLFEKKTFAEIGNELDLSPRTVDKHIELAKKDLRRDLTEYLRILLILFILR
jgi:RNA polymerase sigma-70 factor (ECF subfamily)